MAAIQKHRILLVTLVLVIVGPVAAQLRTERTGKPGVKTVRGEGIYAALQEPVPPIVLHRAVFGRPVQLSRARALGVDGRGAPSTAPVVLIYASSGVVIGKDNNAFRVDVGDPVSIGDFIIGGVVENSGSTAVHLFYNGGGEVQLNPGERLYVGTEARILEPPGAEGGVAASEDEPELLVIVDSDGRGHTVFVDANGHVALANGASPTAPSPTHCAICSCSCSGGGSCAVTITPDTNSCSGLDGEKCTCTSHGPAGNLSGCTIVFKPCGGNPQ